MPPTDPPLEGTPRDPVLLNLYAEHIIAVPPAAQPMYVALMRAYMTTGGEVEVFTERFDDGRSTMRIRPSNVHGHLEISFGQDGHVSDVTWSDER